MTLRGVVNHRREAVATLRVRGPGGGTSDVAAIIDTGFTGALCLPAATVAALGLICSSSRTARLGDGSIRQIDLYDAEVEWGGNWRPVLVYATGREPLIGMRLPAGHQLRIEVTSGGAVEVSPLP